MATTRTSAHLRRLFGLLIVLSVFVPLAFAPVIGMAKGWTIGLGARFYPSGVSLGILLGTTALLLARRRGLITMPLPLVAMGVLFAAVEVLVDAHRSVWLSGLVLVVALAYMGEIRLSRFWRWGPAILAVVLLAAAVATAWGLNPVEYVAQRGQALIEPSADPTSSWRLTHWKYELLEVRDSLLAGTGFGGYFSVYIPEYGYKITVAPHNLYILTLVKQGIVGLALYLSIAVAAGNYLRRNMNPRGDPEVTLEGFLTRFGLVSLLVASTYFMVYASDWHAVLWVGLGLAAAASRAVPSQSKPDAMAARL